MSEIVKGTFYNTLTRNNKTIKDDRAEEIVNDTERVYKRKVDDLRYDIDKLKRARAKLLDLSPVNTLTLQMIEHDADDFVDRDVQFGVEIRNLEIKLKIAQERYNTLFTVVEETA